MVIMTTFPPPTEGLHHIQDKTEAFVQDKSCGVGTLYIAEERLSWCDSSGQGFSLEYPSISLHAICRDTSQFPHECIYCMMESPLSDPSPRQDDVAVQADESFKRKGKHGNQRNFDNENDGASDDSDDKVGEVRFVPEDKSALEAMFKSLSECQVLHPDPEDEEQALDEDFFCDADEEELSEQGQATLQRLEGIMQMPSQEEFVQMTADSNGHCLNGHDSMTADAEMEHNGADQEQFEDADK